MYVSLSNTEKRSFENGPDRPELKLKTEPPEREQIVVRVSPEVKARLEWVAEADRLSDHENPGVRRRRRTRSAIVLKARTLEPGAPRGLPVRRDEPRRHVSAEKRFRRLKIDVPDEEVVVSAMITSEARAQFDLYCARRASMPLGVIIDQLASSMEKRLQRALAARARARAGARSVDLARVHDAGERRART